MAKITTTAKKALTAKDVTPTENFSIIAIGASAGGLEALQEFLSQLPNLPNGCIIIAQHLSPTHKSMLVQLLSRETKLVVAEAVNNTPLEANKIYITPPDKEILINNNKIILRKPPLNAGPKPSVDVLFHSLAENKVKHLIGIILSGTGSDGASGVKALKMAGGFILVQDPATAKYNGMPLAAIETGSADLILPPEKMGEEIKDFLNNPEYVTAKTISANETSSIDKIIKLLSKRTGTNFSNYKSATILRRLEKRMEILKIRSIETYLELLEKKPKEVDDMFNMLLIGVTTFFRDMEAFGVLENYLHKIINSKTNKESIRIWTPGCSTGEEAYSIAILLHRILKDRIQNYNIQIFATDIDERAIVTARKGIYAATALSDVPAEIKEQYFTANGKNFELIKAIRSMVLFTKHDLTNNPPFLKLDLISCRNLLIYFDAGLQQQIIPIFHYSLLQDGYLFLGKSETIGQFTDLFSTLDGKNKFFQRKRGGQIRNIKFSAFKAQTQNLPVDKPKKIKAELSVSDLVKETLFNTYEHPYVIINDQHDVLEINGDLRLFLSLPQGAIQVNLLKMVNPELQIELRSIVTKAIKQREVSRSSIKKFELFSNTYYVKFTAKPLMYTEAANDLFMVVFERLDLDEFVSKGIITNDAELVDARVQELEHELTATKEHLQTYIEELETSNEEMQSLNEEMQSTNEELQSSNEELETSNEELQSTNEEVQIAYSELKATHEELEKKEGQLIENEANIQALLNNTLQGFILIDTGYRIISYNSKALDIFYQLQDKKLQNEASFIDFVSPKELEKFISDFTKVAKGETIHQELKLKDVIGKEYWFSVNYTPVISKEKKVLGISIGILDITDLKLALSELNEKEKLISSVFDATSIGICITDDKGLFVDVNDSYCEIYGYSKDELIAQHFTMMVAPSYKTKAKKLHDDFLISGEEVPSEWEVFKKDGQPIKIFVTASLLVSPNGKRFKVTSVRDITVQKISQREVSLLINNTKECFILVNKDLKITLFNQQVSKVYYQLLGIQIQLGDNVFDYTTPERIENLKTICTTVLKGEEITTEVDFVVLDGTTKTFSFDFTPAYDELGQIEGIFITGRDITDEKQTNKKISDSEKRFRAMVENGADAIIIVDAAMQPKYISPSSHKIFGYTEDESLQLDSLQSFHPDDLPLIQQKFEMCLASPLIPVKEVIYRVKHKDGSWLWIEATLTNFLSDDAISGIVVNISDITNKKEFETQLTNINNNVDCVIYRYELTADGKDRFLYVSDGSKKLWGLEPEEVIKDASLVWQLIYKEDVQSLIDSIQHSAKTLEQWKGEWRVNHPDGYTRWYKGSGSPQKTSNGSIIWNSVLTDITESKLKEQEIERIKRNQESLINGTQDLIWSVNKEMKIITANTAYINFMKIATSKDIKEGEPVIVEEFGEELVKKWKNLYQCALNGESFSIKESVFDSLHNTTYYSQISFNPMYDADGTSIGVACYSKDITNDTLNLNALQASKDELNKIMDSSVDVICTIDEAGCFIKLNSAAEKIWGYDLDELIGKMYIDFVHPDDHPKTIEAAEEIISGKELTNFENRYIKKNGDLIPIIWSAKWDARLKCMFCVARDGSAKVAAEEQLKQSEQRFKTLVQDGSDLIGILDAEANYIYVSPTSEQIVGYLPEEFIGKNAFEFIHPDDIPSVFAQFQSLAELKKMDVTPFRFKNKLGNWRWIETTVTDMQDEPSIRGIVANSRDITDRILIEQQVKESEKKYKNLFENNPAPMIIWDFKTLKIVDCNEEAIAHYGYTKEEFIGLSIKNIRPNDEISDIESATISEEAYGNPHRRIWRHKKKNGDIIMMDITGHLIDYNGRRCALVMLIDITDKYVAEKALALSNQRFEYATIATSDIIWDWDFTTNQVYYASNIEILLGYPNAQRHDDLPFYYDYVHPDDQHKLNFTIADFKKRADDYWTEEYRVKNAEGKYINILDNGILIRDENGEAIRVVGSMRDITKQKQEEEYLKLLSSVITNTNDAVLITEAEPVDGYGPKIVYANDSLLTMTGYSKEEIIGKTPRILQGPKSDRKELDRLRKALENWEPCEITTINYTKTGEEFWVNFAVKPIANESGWYTHWISIQRDVTKAKLEELQKELFTELSLLFNKSLDLPSILQEVIETIAHFGEFQLAEAWLVMPNTNTLVRVATCVLNKQFQYFFDAKNDKSNFIKGEGIAGSAWAAKQVQYLDNITKDKNYFKRETAKKAGIHSAAGVPLIYNNEVIGVLAFFSNALKFNQQKVKLLFSEISTQIAVEVKRKQAEVELDKIFNYAPDIIAIAGFDGYFKKVNPAFCNMLGYSETEILSRPFVDFVHVDDKNKTLGELTNLSAGITAFLFENRYRTKNGKYITISWTANPSEKEGLIFAVGKNISEQKELQALLDRTNEMARIGGWELNLVTNELYWSSITKEIHGVAEDFVPSLETAVNYYKEGAENRAILENAIATCIADGTPWDVELIIITPAGEEKWVKAKGEAEFDGGKCIRIYGSFQDIDAFKSNELAIIAALFEKNEILESIGDAFFAVDKNWTVTYWNYMAEKVLGKTRADILNKHLWEEYTDAVETPFYVYYHKAMAENTIQHFEANYETLNAWYEVSVYPSKNGLSVYFKDVTERKLYEQQLQQLNRSLDKQKNDLEISNKELEQFAFIASHDLQEPLRMVTSFLSQLDRKYGKDLNDNAKEYIAFAVDGAKRMRQLILDLLEYSRAGKHDEAPGPININDLLQEIRLLYKVKIEELNASISFAELPTIISHISPIRQVFQNLIGNALKYIRKDVQPAITINFSETKHHWQFDISDNGIGIEAQYFDRIFIIFQRLHNKNEFNGTGIGLAVTKKIIESLGGNIWVQSEKDKGSTFHFTILKKSIT